MDTKYTEPCVNTSIQSKIIPPDTTTPTVMDWALCYCHKGWHVFPVWGIRNGKCCCAEASECPSPGKHPVKKGWQNSASSDPDKVGKWDWKDYNIGIRTGLVSNLYIVDIDVKRDGLENLMEFEKKNGFEFFPMYDVHTGGGGHHYYFEHPRVDFKLGNKQGKTSPIEGIDIKTNGGYVVAPPSMHVKGKRYVWGV